MLPPLLAFALYGYWRFLSSDAFRVLLERALSRALAAEVRIGSHELGGVASIALRGLSAEFLAGSRPSGVSFRAEEARSYSSGVLGIGAIEKVTLSDVELRVDGPASNLAKLDLIARGARGAAVRRVELERAGFSFVWGGSEYRISGTNWALDFSEGKTRLAAELRALRVEGVSSSALDAEAPEIAFDIEIEGDRVALKRLEVSGRSGWRLAGDLEVNLGVRPSPAVVGELELWDLRVSRIYSPPPGVEITPGASVRRTIRLSGPADDLAMSVTTKVTGLSYADRPLGLEASEVTLDVSGSGRLNVLDLLRRVVKAEP